MGLLIGGGRKINDQQYLDRFYWVRNTTSELNRAGYGPSNPFRPPLESPETIFGIVERHNLLIEQGFVWNILWMISKPFMTFVKSVGNGDAWDLYWYNNDEAEGY